MNKKILGAAVVGSALLTAGTSFAAADGEKKKRQLTDEMKSALQSNDYQAFSKALPEGKTISEEKFESRVEFFQARESGDVEKLAELRAERKAQREVKKALVKEAIDNDDFDSFVELLGDRGKDITEDHFEIIRKIHEAKKGGDMETVKELRAELKADGIKVHGKKKGEKRGGNR